MAVRAWRRAALIAAPIVALLSVSAQTAMSAMAAHPAQPTAAMSTRSAPAVGAIPVAATPDIASPAQGTTGTIALPPEPIDAPAPAAFDTTVTAARPFLTGGARALDRGRALECLAAAIYYEAASEPDDGQRAVAQVVLNRVRHPAFPGTVCGVVYQGSERMTGCQFSFACDGAMARLPSRAGWARATRIAAAALAGQVFAPVGLATHYHTYAVTPAWNRTLVMTDAIGAHFFHRWKGYWGTAAAFSQRYAGNEPVPGPHPRAFAPGPAPLVLAATGATAPAPSAAVPVPPQTPDVQAAQVQPAHVDSGRALTTTDGSQILDRWKESGRPLR